MSVLDPIYTTIASVKARLAGKVQFQSSADGSEEGELPDLLLSQLIVDSETDVEQDLRGRYAVPFRSATYGTWADLPDHSRRAIRKVVDMKCVMAVLTTDFGKGSHISGDKYFESLEKQYTTAIDKLLGRDQEAANAKIDRYRRTLPLDDVKLAPGNEMADDGYKGMVINTNQDLHDTASYAAEQVDDPSKSVFRRPGGFPR